MNLLKCNEVNIISRYDRRRPWEKFSSTKIKYIVSQKPKWLFAHFVFFYLFATASNAVYTPLIMNSPYFATNDLEINISCLSMTVLFTSQEFVIWK